MPKQELLVFTTSFPYGEREPFLEAELPYLTQQFQVRIIPRRFSGKMVRPLPKGVQVDSSLASGRPRGFLFYVVCGLVVLKQQEFWKEIGSDLRTLNPRSLSLLVWTIGEAVLTSRWLRQQIATSQVSPYSVAYTFWFNGVTLGIHWARPATMPLISRAHRCDLYEEEYPLSYLPSRRQLMEGVDSLLLSSRNGYEYVLKRWPTFREKIRIAPLATERAAPADRSHDKIFRIVSCSAIRTVKRLPLIVESIAQFAKDNPEVDVEWIHFGGGKGKRLANKIANRYFSNTRVNWEIRGYVPRYQLLAHYQDAPVDVFINLSRSEGAPVSIIEALSAGIPIIATNVGANCELVGEDNGVLMGADPSPNDVAGALWKIHSYQFPEQLRTASQRRWEKSWSAEQIYPSFATDLLKYYHNPQE